jgi:hypothetical protein
MSTSSHHRSLAHDERRIDRAVRSIRELNRDGAEAGAADRLAACFKCQSQHTSWMRLRGGMQVQRLLVQLNITTDSLVVCSGGG